MGQYTLDEWMTGIGNAEKAGDTKAAAELRQKAQADLTGPATVTEKIGAGVADVTKAIGRWAGVVSPEQYAEHKKIAAQADPGGWYRMAGQIGATAPLMLIPGVNSVAGGLVAGGGLGALMDPEDPLKGAAMGTIGAGVVPAARTLIPKAWNAAMNTVARNTPFLPGRKQDIAERAFQSAIPEAERAGVQQTLATYPGSPIPGFEQTTGAATRNPHILEIERRLSQGGSPFGAPLKERAGEQAQAVNQAWESEFGRRGGKLQSDILREGRESFVDANLPVRFPRAPVQSDFPNVARAFNSEFQNASGAHAATLQTVRDHLVDAMANAERNGLTVSLHNWRRTEINDALQKMFREGATQGQKITRESLDRIKAAFDQDMDKLLGQNRWSDFMQGYRGESAKISQAAAGEEMLAQLRKAPEMAIEQGVHDPTAVTRNLRTQFAEGSPVTRYGTREYSPSGETLLRDTMNEMGAANLMHAKDVAPVNSATAANLRQPLKILSQADAAQRTLGDPGALRVGHLTGAGIGGAVGTMLGGPAGGVVGGIAGEAGRRALAPARAAALADIAQRVVGLYTDPRAAKAALDRLALPPAERSLVAKMIEGHLMRAGAVAAAGP